MMSETVSAPKINTATLRKKVLGIPVLAYLAVFAGIIALYAWKTAKKPAIAGDATTAAPASGSATTGDLGSLATTGTVVVAAQVPPAVANTAIQTDDEWLTKGVAFIQQTEPNASPGDVQAALQAYLSGGQLSSKQGVWRDKAIAQYGLPPRAPDVSGTQPSAQAEAAAKTAASQAAAQAAVDQMIGGSSRRAAIVAGYRSALGRTPALSEVNYWDSRTDLSTDQIQHAIVVSAEARK